MYYFLTCYNSIYTFILWLISIRQKIKEKVIGLVLIRQSSSLISACGFDYILKESKSKCHTKCHCFPSKKAISNTKLCCKLVWGINLSNSCFCLSNRIYKHFVWIEVKYSSANIPNCLTWRRYYLVVLDPSSLLGKST